ncbi:hypothetical protein CR511_07880 [Pseudomonas putida]|nr:hypothetical protein CR511_07880 [Pseudomonas putida]
MATLTQVYTAYGYSERSPSSTLLGFNGERLAVELASYLLGNGYRAFSTVLMRFQSPDSFSPFGEGGFNSYAYCSNEPVKRCDPSGHIDEAFTRHGDTRRAFRKPLNPAWKSDTLMVKFNKLGEQITKRSFKSDGQANSSLHNERLTKLHNKQLAILNVIAATEIKHLAKPKMRVLDLFNASDTPMITALLKPTDTFPPLPRSITPVTESVDELNVELRGSH